MEPKLKITTSSSQYQIKFSNKTQINFSKLGEVLKSHMTLNDSSIFKTAEYFPAMYGSTVYKTVTISREGYHTRKVPEPKVSDTKASKSKTKVSKTFRNQMQVILMNGPSVKIFTNGCLHLMGFKSTQEIMSTIEEILNLISSTLKFEEIDVKPDPNLLNFCSINGIYSFPKVDPSTFHDISEFLKKNHNLITYSDTKTLKIYLLGNHTRSFGGDTLATLECKCPLNYTCGQKKRSGYGPGECVLITLTLHKTGLIRIHGVIDMITMDEVCKFIEKYINV